MRPVADGNGIPVVFRRSIMIESMRSPRIFDGGHSEIRLLQQQPLERRDIAALAGTAYSSASGRNAKSSAPVKSKYAITGSSTSESTAQMRTNRAKAFERQFPAHWYVATVT